MGASNTSARVDTSSALQKCVVRASPVRQKFVFSVRRRRIECIGACRYVVGASEVCRQSVTCTSEVCVFGASWAHRRRRCVSIRRRHVGGVGVSHHSGCLVSFRIVIKFSFLSQESVPDVTSSLREKPTKRYSPFSNEEE